MSLQSSGAISILDVATEFGGSAPHALSEYYGAGGAPSSGALDLSDFYGLSNQVAAPSSIVSSDYAPCSYSSVTISWTASATSGVTYYIYRTTSTTFSTTTLKYSGTALSITQSFSSTLYNYYFWVVAKKSGMTDSTPIRTPTNIHAQSCGSCFTKDTIVIDELGQHRRIDSIRPGDYLFGLGGVNRVIGIEKVPVVGRPLYKLAGTNARFTGEHPFMLANGHWGSFDKEAMDREIMDANLPTIIQTANGLRNVVGDKRHYNENTIKQITNGDLGVSINNKPIPLNAYLIDDTEEFVYTFFMDGSRTFNVDGVVVSGLALTGENTQLIEVKQ